MARGISIHIGLNRVDPAQYDGWDGALGGCINDATEMSNIAQQNGFYPITVLLDDQATSTQVLEEISSAATSLEAGDILFLTYSGHGGQVPDVNGDEEDGNDETWVLFDRMLMDDELYLLWSQFAPGVRIVMLSDSCHSGTLLKQAFHKQMVSKSQFAQRSDAAASVTPTLKLIPPEAASANFIQHESEYKASQWLAVRGKNTPIEASVILISGCQDSQLSGDGFPNGVFTAALLDVWQNGSFRGSYRSLWRQIAAQMPPYQSPNFYTVGRHDPAFEEQQPFSIDPMSSASVSLPRIALSPLWNSGAPVFEIAPGDNPYYGVEVAAEANLFNWAEHGMERTADNFYASYEHVPLMIEPTYTLDEDGWNALSASSARLYYRILTSSVSHDFQNIMASTEDAQADTAPYLEFRRVSTYA